MAPKQRLDWKFHLLIAVDPSTDLLAFANKWVKDHNFHGTPKFGNFVVEGQPAGCQIATCKRHIGCKKKVQFTRRSRAVFGALPLPPRDGETFVLIETVGVCDGPLNLKAIKKKNCRDLAEYNHSPGKQGELFDHKRIGSTERPSDRAMERRRWYMKSKREGTDGRRYDGAFLETLRNFCDNPPPGVIVLTELVALTETVVEIPFFCREVAEHATALHTDADQILWTLDATYNTNIQRLALLMVGSSGSVLPPGKSSVPHMRVAPIVYVLALRENTPSYDCLVKAAALTYAVCNRSIYDESRHLRVSDIWVDGHLGALTALEELLPLATIHQCLQHIKNNVKAESSRKCPRKKTRRIKDQKMIGEFLERIMMMADLPTDEEFHLMAENLIARCHGDWDEESMAAYFEGCTFKMVGDLWSASWR